MVRRIGVLGAARCQPDEVREEDRRPSFKGGRSERRQSGPPQGRRIYGLIIDVGGVESPSPAGARTWRASKTRPAYENLHSPIYTNATYQKREESPAADRETQP